MNYTCKFTIGQKVLHNGELFTIKEIGFYKNSMDVVCTEYRFDEKFGTFQEYSLSILPMINYVLDSSVNKIKNIKAAREHYSIGLKDAKNLVESLMAIKSQQDAIDKIKEIQDRYNS